MYSMKKNVIYLVISNIQSVLSEETVISKDLLAPHVPAVSPKLHLFEAMQLTAVQRPPPVCERVHPSL